MSARIRSRTAVRLVVAALVAWFVVTQITDWPVEVMIAGVGAITLGVVALDRRVG